MTDLKIKVVKKPVGKNNQLELAVETLPEVSDKAYTIAYRDIANNIDIPGFRKGKAPRDVVEKRVGVGYISQKAFENIFYEILIGAAVQEKLEIVDVVEVSSYELLPGKPLTFKATVELKPEVKLGKYKGMKVKSKKYEYDENLFVEKTLQKIVNNMVTYTKPLKRDTVKEGDLIVINFEGKFEDGTEVPGGKAENFQVLLEKDKFLPEFVDKLQGVKIAEEKEIQIKFPDNYSKEMSGKNATFKVVINSIEEKVIPAIDNELAKKLGLESLDELRKKIVSQMVEIQDLNNQRELENKIVEHIVENSKFEISERMIEKEIDFLLHDLRVQYEQNGIPWTNFKNDEKNKETLNKARDAAIKRISFDLVLGSIIKDEKIIASKDEIEKEVANRISQLGEKYKNLENDNKFRSNIELIVLRNKAVDFLLNNNEAEWEKEVAKLTPD